MKPKKSINFFASLLTLITVTLTVFFADLAFNGKGVEAYWQRRYQPFFDPNPDYLHFMCRPEMGFNCLNTTKTPMARHGHVAIVYRTYGYEYCAKFVEIDFCFKFNKENKTCPVCLANEENKLARNKLVTERKALKEWRGPENPACPADCCPEEENPRSDCKRSIGQHGQAIHNN